MRNKYTLLLIVQLFCSPIFSQQMKVYKGLDGGTATATEKTKNEKATDIYEKNTIAISLAHLVRNMAVVGYERCIGNRFSAKISGGYCFNNDRFLLMGNMKNSPKINFYRNFSYAKADNYYTDFTGKIFTNLFPSSYTSVDYRWYIALQYRNYKQNFKPSSQYYTPSSVTKIPINTSAVLVQIGEVLYSMSSWSLEYYIGFGKASAKLHEYIYDASTNQTIYNSAITTEKRNLFVGGINLGYNF